MKRRKQKQTVRRFASVAAVAVGVVILCLSSVPARADQYDVQIQALQQQLNAQRAQAAAFRSQANDYRSKVADLNAQMEVLQIQIDLNQAKYTKVSADIEDAKANLAKQKNILNENIRTIYQQGNVSSLEILASSDNFSDYVNKQEYSQKVKDKVEDSLATITKLKTELEKQQTELAGLLKDQNAQRDQLAATRAEADSLLALAQQNASAADQQVRDSNNNIAQLRAQQAAAIAALGGTVSYGGSGGYPWANAPWPNSIPDPWGMYERQCVSYTAWKVANSGRNMPYWGGRGNANQWPSNARAAGIPVDGNPRVGDVAILMNGEFGHAMYVEAVLGGGRIRVSQYNAAWDGRYSVAEYSSSGLLFIHF